MKTPALALENLDDTSSEDNTIRKLVEQAQTFNPQEHGRKIHAFFGDHPAAEGAVILDRGNPVGLVMRNDFYQKLGSLYGRDLFMHRPIQLIMNAEPLIVDVSVDIATIGLIAMNRAQEHLYDMVVVTEDDAYIGIVSIQRFMIELSRSRGDQIELLKKQKDILRLANEAEIEHRRQIEEKSIALREMNDSIRNLMDNAGQGFLSFGSDRIVSEEYSQECVQLFRGPIGGKDILELFGKHVTPEVSETFVSALGSIFAAQKALQQKVFLSLLPKEICLFEKAVRIEYKVIQHLDQKRMMLVLTDITDKKKLEMKAQEERNNMKMVVTALSKQSDVNMAMDELQRFVAMDAPGMIGDAESAVAPWTEIFRAIHTFKGDFAQFGLHNTARKLHAVEDSLAVLGVGIENRSKEELAATVKTWDARVFLHEDKAVLTETIGKSFFEKDERFSISKEKLIELERKVEAVLTGPERKEVLDELRSLRRHDFRDLLRQYEDYLILLAERLEKPLEGVFISGDPVLVDKDAYLKFNKSLVHVFRNMIDHGIEDVDRRLEAGKSELGRIVCRVGRIEDNEICLSISDDGNGIDTRKVLAKAVEKGILSADVAGGMSPREVYDLLFLDSFSTKETVGSLSGRGVGLAAVKAETERLGGRIQVESELGKGSTFRFFLPLRND